MKPTSLFNFVPILVVAVLAGVPPPPAFAQVTMQQLKSFGVVDQAGVSPYAALIQGSDGMLYGTTFQGGPGGSGTVFKCNTNGGAYVVLHSFGATAGDGQNPQAGLVQGTSGALYGTTYQGGAYNGGTVFRVNWDGTGYTVLRSLGASSDDGKNPYAGLIQGGDGTLYGTTYSGGSSNVGTVFKINPNGGGYANLHVFGTPGDGRGPKAALVRGSDGALYGTTYLGGTNNGAGTVFVIGTSGAGYAVLRHFAFSGSTGFYPNAALIQGRDGALYGTTYRGGTYDRGTVFKLSTDGGGYAVLQSLRSSGGDGNYPYAGLVQGSDGALYGTTCNGGTNNVGTVFTIGTDGNNYAVLRSFSTTGGDGKNPYAGLIQCRDGALYGTTFNGGASGYGTVFRIGADGGGYSVQLNFSPTGGDGQQPKAALLQGKDGALYGTTYGGGTFNGGTVFKTSTNGTGYVVLHNFSARGDDGLNPVTSLIQDQAGVLYGTTFNGGSNNVGTVFRLHADGTAYTNLHCFSTTGGDGYYPLAVLVQGTDGALYGTTQSGGSNYLGMVFKINPDGGGYTNLYSFLSTGGDGKNPNAGLVQGTNGVLYGTTYGGGIAGKGTVFKINPDGSGYVNLCSLGTSGDGQNPQGALLWSRDGVLFGTTANGGSASKGTVFRINPDGGGYQPLWHFGATVLGDGANPQAGLLLGAEGTLYGTTYNGGISNAGALFQLSTTGGGYNIRHSFATVAGEGKNPQAALIQGRDGALYGTTVSGGSLGMGTIFSVAFYAPTIGSPPETQIVRLGATATFSVIATGTEPLLYQWRFNGTNVPGATDSTLTMTDLARSNYGVVAVAITNYYGDTLSSNATLLVVAPRLLSAPAFTADGVEIATTYPGDPLQASDVPRFHAQASTNLVNWFTLTNALTLIDEQLVLTDRDGTNYPMRFYRVFEVWP